VIETARLRRKTEADSTIIADLNEQYREAHDAMVRLEEDMGTTVTNLSSEVAECA
jgi:hypothetical protein